MRKAILTTLALLLCMPAFAGGQWLKQSTAVTVKIGPFIDDSDGKTAETLLTISQADVRLSKNGGNYAQKTEVNAAVHDELGEYNCAIDATDTNTLGRLRLTVQESGALPVWHDYMVLPANVYDSLVAGSDKLDVTLDNSAHGGAAATLALESIVIDNDAGVGLSVTGSTIGVSVIGEAGSGIKSVSSGSNGNALELTANGTGDGIKATGGATGDGAYFSAGATSGTGFYAISPTAGNGMTVIGNAGGHHGFEAEGVTSGIYGHVSSAQGSGISGIGTGSNNAGILGRCDAGWGMKLYSESAGKAGLQLYSLHGMGLDLDSVEGGVVIDNSAGPGLHIAGTTYGAELTASAGSGLSAVASAGNNSGIVATKAGTGYDIDADIHGTLDTVTTLTTKTGFGLAADQAVNATKIEGGDATDAIQSAADAALVANHLDHLLKTNYDPAVKPGVATALLNEIVENDVGVSRFTQNALEQGPDSDTTSGLNLDAAYNAAKTASQAGDAMDLVADAVDAAAVKADAVTEIQSGLATSTALGTAQTDLDTLTGTDGATLATAQGLYAPAKAGDAMALTADQAVNTTKIEGQALGAKAGDNFNVFFHNAGADTTKKVDNVGGGEASVSAQDKADIVDGVWDEVQTGHVTAGTFGKYLDTTVSSRSTLGDGQIIHTYSLTNSVTGVGIVRAVVRVTTDVAGVNTVAAGYTNSSGQAVFHLDADTYYFWRTHDDYTFSNPDTEVVE